MQRTRAARAFFSRAAILLVAFGVAGCTTENQLAPPLAGPSEFGLSVTLQATPDQLPRDGSSQSTVTVTVRDAQSRPVSGQRLSVGSSMGTVSQTSVVTNSEGQASFAVTAPSSGSIGNTVVVQVVPVGGNADNAVARTLSILLTGIANSSAPTAAFTFSPSAPDTSQSVRFDASTTQDEGGACLDACSYSWNFGDGTSGAGRIVTHTFTTGRSHTVTLTVTDAAGSTASAAQVVTVAAVPAPTVTLTVAPNPPLAGQQATFTATATAATGHSITRFAWNFGDGTSQTTTTPTVTKTYAAQGVYVATVTVTDDLGRTGSNSLQLSIANSAVNATIVVSPTNPKIGDDVHFTAVNPTAPDGATISKYEWNFGDPAQSSGGTAEGQSVQHSYSAARTYVVRLTITDSQGRVGTVTKEVTVATN